MPQHDGEPRAPCQFNPNGEPQGGAATTANGDGMWLYNTGYWIYGQDMPVAYTDTSAKFVTFGNGASLKSPFLAVDSKGVASSGYRCRSSASSPAYLAWFRPDLDTYTLGTTSGGLCQ